MNCLLCERVGIKPDGSPGGLDYTSVCDSCTKIYEENKSKNTDYSHMTREELENELDLWKQTCFFSDKSGDPIDDPVTVAKINMEMLNDIERCMVCIDDPDLYKELDEKYRTE